MWIKISPKEYHIQLNSVSRIAAKRDPIILYFMDGSTASFGTGDDANFKVNQTQFDQLKNQLATKCADVLVVTL